MIRRTVVVASTILGMTLLGAPGAMASVARADITGQATAATSCTGTLHASKSPTAVTVTGTVQCTAASVLAVNAAATAAGTAAGTAGQVSVAATSPVNAAANVTTAVDMTIPLPGCTSVTAAMVDTATGATVATTTG
ncbi:MAG: hypothetical protein E6F99_08595 [Actinobacteria bacterium]|nr:MAG: hypothetical protein E6F99_08595 [Actinomycetota bacterium]